MQAKSSPAGPPAIDPVHPGAILREDVIPSLRISITAAAMKVSRQMLHAILAEKASITPEMAIRIGKFCGNGPDFWMALQTTHDLWRASREMQAIVATIPTMKAA
jgi:addiction module HigA family antidote